MDFYLQSIYFSDVLSSSNKTVWDVKSKINGSLNYSKLEGEDLMEDS
jgi:hypothetical protein